MLELCRNVSMVTRAFDELIDDGGECDRDGYDRCRCFVVCESRRGQLRWLFSYLTVTMGLLFFTEKIGLFSINSLKVICLCH